MTTTRERQASLYSHDGRHAAQPVQLAAPPLRSHMIRLETSFAFVVAAVVGLAACKHDEPNYCPDAPHGNCMNDGQMSCTTSAQCSGATPVCDVGGTNTCVQCTTDQSGECAGATPVC